MRPSELDSLAREAMTLFRDDRAKILANLAIRVQVLRGENEQDSIERGLLTMNVLREIATTNGAALDALVRRVRDGSIPWE
jgi:hypothetical protein